MAGPALTRSVLKSVARDPNKKDLYLTSDISGNMWVGSTKIRLKVTGTSTPAPKRACTTSSMP